MGVIRLNTQRKRRLKEELGELQSPIAIRLPKAVDEWLEYMATDSRRYKSEIIRHMLEDWYWAEKGEQTLVVGGTPLGMRPTLENLIKQILDRVEGIEEKLEVVEGKSEYTE
jgi:hypothetical protein